MENYGELGLGRDRRLDKNSSIRARLAALARTAPSAPLRASEPAVPTDFITFEHTLLEVTRRFIIIDGGGSLRSAMIGSTLSRKASFLFFALALFLLVTGSSAAVDPKSIPVVDGGLGSCSAEFTIADTGGQPVYAANIQVHIAYGLMSLHKMDLQVGTNADGKARFEGLPDRVKQGLFFRASEGSREGSAFDDPGKTCKAAFAITLRQKPPDKPE
jgi:hypothetical protein